MDLMEKNTNQMLQLVNQILDFRKIQNGKMRLHVSLIDFNEMIASFQKEFRVLSEENEISFTFQLPDEPIMVWADKEKMSIVIRNIISNAFKFTHSGGSIYITTGLTDDGKRCYVRVEDNGVGIPQNKLTEIFERFSQGENAKTPIIRARVSDWHFQKRSSICITDRFVLKVPKDKGRCLLWNF